MEDKQSIEQKTATDKSFYVNPTLAVKYNF